MKTDTQRAKIKRRYERRLELAIEWVNEYKPAMGCADCGVTGLPAVCYDFDHLDPSTKVKSISRMVYAGRTIGAIRREADKCEVVCANCHRIRTWL